MKTSFIIKSLIVMHETQKALLLSPDGVHEAWVPKSVCKKVNEEWYILHWAYTQRPELHYLDQNQVCQKMLDLIT